MHGDLPLFAWQPPSKLIVFPTIRRVGKIRTTAERLLAKSTSRASDHYRRQVSEALLANFERLGVAEADAHREVIEFWSAVDREMVRRQFGEHGGAA